MIDAKFKKGDKAFTVSDQGCFKILEIEITGIRYLYEDFEADKPVRDEILYCFYIGQDRKFGKPDIIFATRDEAVVKLEKMLPEYRKGYDEEISNTEKHLQEIKEYYAALESSAQELITIKT